MPCIGSRTIFDDICKVFTKEGGFSRRGFRTGQGHAGFRVVGFRALGFRALGFRVKGLGSKPPKSEEYETT